MSSPMELAAACASSTVSAGLRFSQFQRLGLVSMNLGSTCTIRRLGHPSEVGIMVEAGQSTLLKIADVPPTARSEAQLAALHS